MWKADLLPTIHGNPTEPNSWQCFRVLFENNVYQIFTDNVFMTFMELLILRQSDYNLLIIWIINILNSNLFLKLNKTTVSLFLEVKIWKTNNRFTTSDFRKPVISEDFTNCFSFIPMSYKNGVVNTLIFWCFEMCFSYENFVMNW